MLESECLYLSKFTPGSSNLHELNHLAQRLAALSDWELDCFKGKMMMDAAKRKSNTIAVERLIHFSHSMENCQIAYHAHDDESLGKFYEEKRYVRCSGILI